MIVLLKANLKEAASSLATARQRSLLALLGIVIGVGSVIAMVSVGVIVRGEALKQFSRTGHGHSDHSPPAREPRDRPPPPCPARRPRACGASHHRRGGALRALVRTGLPRRQVGEGCNAHRSHRCSRGPQQAPGRGGQVHFRSRPPPVFLRGRGAGRLGHARSRLQTHRRRYHQGGRRRLYRRGHAAASLAGYASLRCESLDHHPRLDSAAGVSPARNQQRHGAHESRGAPCGGDEGGRRIFPAQSARFRGPRAKRRAINRADAQADAAVRAAAGICGGHLASHRRDRGHERHAGIGERAASRDRHQAGSRCAGARTSRASS